jgi:DNA-binding transcriptional ArsR family regulator
MINMRHTESMRINAFDERERTLRVAKALASPYRLSLLMLLAEDPMSLAQVQANLNHGRYRSSVYRHLEALKAAGLLEKSYDDQAKALTYRLSARRIELVLSGK